MGKCLRRSIIQPNKHIKKSQEFMAFFIVIIALLAFGLFFLVLNKVVGSVTEPITTGLQSALPNGDADANITKYMAQTSSASFLFDKMLPFVIIGLFAFVMILGGSFMQHPLLIIAGIIILGIVILLAAVYSNVYEEIANSDSFTDTTDDMPIQTKFMQFLPYIIGILAVAVTLSVIISRKGGGYVGY